MNPLEKDLDQILLRVPGVWNELRNTRILITGGTGWFGCWLTEALLWGNAKLGTNIDVWITTRNAAAYRSKAPHLASQVHVVEDSRCAYTGFDMPFDYVIHAASTDGVELRTTLNVLMFAERNHVKNILIPSSGAAYGRETYVVFKRTHIIEDCLSAPDTMAPGGMLGETKRLLEMECAEYCRSAKIDLKVARCFSFVGPYMPFGRYAIGNFIRDAVQGNPIVVTGDGTPRRSYMYMADCVVWLLSIMLFGEPSTLYNVGSEHAWSLEQIAQTVRRVIPGAGEVQVLGTHTYGEPVERYVPSTMRVRHNLGLRMYTQLEEAIQKTADWYREQCYPVVGG